jgi:hypothetical protein
MKRIGPAVLVYIAKLLLRAGEVIAGGATAVTLAFRFDRLSLFPTRREALRRANKS